MPKIIRPIVEFDLPRPEADTPLNYTPDFRGADLRGADARSAVLDDSLFTSASFRRANFTRADFSGAIFNNCIFESAIMDGVSISKKHIALYGLRHLVLITPTHMFIGCMNHTHEDWRNMPLESILAQDEGAAEIWGAWKDALLGVCATLATGIL